MNNDIQFIYNKIDKQNLLYARELTIRHWNFVINSLREQTNDTTKYLETFHKFMFGDTTSLASFIIETSGHDSFYAYIHEHFISKRFANNTYINKNLISYASVKNTIPMRDDNGCINIQYPTSGSHGANKQYVDDHVNNILEVIANVKGNTLILTYDTLQHALVRVNTKIENGKKIFVSITNEDDTVTYSSEQAPLGTQLLIREQGEPDFWLSKKEVGETESMYFFFTPFEGKVNLDNYYDIPTIDEKLANINGGIETDPTVPSWAKQAEKPTYSYNELTDKPTIPNISGLASEAFVNQKIAELVNSAPTTLDTLGEIAAAFQENESVVTALNNAIANKQNKLTAGNGISISAEGVISVSYPNYDEEEF